MIFITEHLTPAVNLIKESKLMNEHDGVEDTDMWFPIWRQNSTSFTEFPKNSEIPGTVDNYFCKFVD